MQHDFLIVGSGLFGAVFSEQAKRYGKKCLIIDKQPHIAGNCYSEKQENIDVHVTGPHIFNTNSDDIWSYVNNFSKFNQYVHKVKVTYKDKIYSFPINMMTLYQVYGVKTPEEARNKLTEVKVKIDNPQNLEEWCLSQVGPELYELFIYGYTKKQWKKDPKNLPASIIKRLPIRLTYDDRYHESKWCGIPADGYTAWVKNIIGDTPVELGVDFFAIDWRQYAKNVVYSGKIDALFNYCYGDLEYRTLRFETKVLDGDYQGVAQMNYTDENVPWTRITEHKHFNSNLGISN
jgi:UDP-galactopyranose mutase